MPWERTRWLRHAVPVLPPSPRVLSIFADCSPKTDETTTSKTLASKEWAPPRMRMAFSRS